MSKEADRPSPEAIARAIRYILSLDLPDAVPAAEAKEGEPERASGALRKGQHR